MAKDRGVNMPTAQRSKGAGKNPPPAKASSTVVADAAPRKRTNPAEFIKEVRAEARKITWTSWKETWITSVMVFIMVVVTAVFFLVVDASIAALMQQILKLASSV